MMMRRSGAGAALRRTARTTVTITRIARVLSVLRVVVFWLADCFFFASPMLKVGAHDVAHVGQLAHRDWGFLQNAPVRSANGTQGSNFHNWWSVRGCA